MSKVYEMMLQRRVAKCEKALASAQQQLSYTRANNYCGILAGCNLIAACKEALAAANQVHAVLCRIDDERHVRRKAAQ